MNDKPIVVKPGIYEYKERYNSRKLRPSDLTAKETAIPKPPNDGLDSMAYKGEKLFFGEGVTREL